MSNVEGMNTSFNLPNYMGELFTGFEDLNKAMQREQARHLEYMVLEQQRRLGARPLSDEEEERLDRHRDRFTWIRELAILREAEAKARAWTVEDLINYLSSFQDKSMPVRVVVPSYDWDWEWMNDSCIHVEDGVVSI